MKKLSFETAICSLAKKTAVDSVNGKCTLILHQPKVPAKLKEYQK